MHSDAASSQPEARVLRIASAWRPTMKRWASRMLDASLWIYCLAVVSSWVLLRYFSDAWWPATVLLFAPRWLLAVPAVPLLAWALSTDRRKLIPLLVVLPVLTFSVLGVCIPWSRAFAPGGPALRVLTYNVAGSSVAPEALADLVSQVGPDIVALQECHFGRFQQVFRDWNVHHEGQLFLASRHPLTFRRMDWSFHPPHKYPVQTLIECSVKSPAGDVTVCTLHLPSPRYGLSAIASKSTIIAPESRGLLEAETSNRREVSHNVYMGLDGDRASHIIAGDFNMPYESTLFRRDWVHYTDAFSVAGWGLGHTMRVKLRGWPLTARIDHVVSGSNWRPVRCWVGPDLGSDHLPLIADLVWQGSPHLNP